MVAKPEGGRDFFCQAILSISKSLNVKENLLFRTSAVGAGVSIFVKMPRLA